MGRVLTKGKYSDLKEPKNVAPGNKTTLAQRKRILEENKNQNGGQLVSDGDGKPVNSPKKLKPGEKRDPREAQIDHIDPKNPKDKSKTPGSNSNSNLQVLSGEENIKKSNK
ncbi:MAG: HNH endonuclease [Chitinophagaceae bacterium]|nr:HNH endonuclease [Chitinophagaceae bacterium]